jgi:uncharacterized protein
MASNSPAGLVKAAAVDSIKALAEPGEFEGYASVFGDRDLSDDVVMPGAFAASLARRPAARVKMLWQHDPNAIIGRWTEMVEDGRGLYVKGKMLLTLDRGREAHELMQAGALDSLSIGYRTIRSDRDGPDGARRLKEVDLMEVSLVTFPALESAQVSLVKGDTVPSEREFEGWLRDAGFSHRQAKAIIADGYKSIRSERDAGADGQGVLEGLRALAETFRR